MRKYGLVLAVALVATARADYFAPGYLESGYFETGYFETDAATVAVPDVIGEASFAAADGVLEGVGLDAGTDTSKCSSQAAGEVIGQSIAPDVVVALGTLVDLTTSSGTPCSGRPPLWLYLETDR